MPRAYAIHVLQELSKVSGAPQPHPVSTHGSTAPPHTSTDITVAAPSSSVHLDGMLPDRAKEPLLDAPAQPALQLQPVDLSSAGMQDAT